jgi:hypothetical protein
MKEHERTITCRDGHPVTFTLENHVSVIRRPDISTEPVAAQTLVGPSHIQSFHCEDCRLLIGCEVVMNGIQPEEDAKKYGANPSYGTVTEIARQRFEKLDLDVNINEKLVFPKAGTLS